ALRGEARQAPGPPLAQRGRARQGLAHRPHPAPPRSDARDRGPRVVAHHHRDRRRARARARAARHRQRRRLCAGRGARAPRQLAARSRRHREEIARDRGRAVHLHQPESRGGNAVSEARPTPAVLAEPRGMMTPQEIVHELDKFIVGQAAAKRAVAIALRNRWRRAHVAEPLRTEITPKNILMIGPTGVGKTEIARRLARLANAPFIKVEATKFTEVGYVGRDVDSIIRDLMEIAVKSTREQEMNKVRTRAEDVAEERILDALLPGVPAADA